MASTRVEPSILFQRTLMRMMLMVPVLCLALVNLCCAKKEQARLPVYPVQGKVLVQGKPVEKVMVVLHPLNGLDLQGAAKPFAKTNADGRFQLSTYDPRDGAPEGKYAVLLFWFKSEADEDGNTDRFQRKYSQPNAPIATVEITKGDNVIKTIEVK